MARRRPFRSMPWACALTTLLLLRLLVTARQGNDTNKNPLLNLRITIRDKDLRNAVSCRHSFAQIELLNDHRTESVEILNIFTLPEETSWLVSSSSNGNGKQEQPQRAYWGTQRHPKNDEDVPFYIDHVPNEQSSTPHQLHVSFFTGQKQLVLAPHQVAILPLTFLPRFPVEHEAHNHRLLSPAGDTAGGTPPPAASPSPVYERTDWDEWVGASRRPVRSNRHSFGEGGWVLYPPQYQVRTTLVIQGTKGAIQIPIPATSSCQNDYGLPSTITLETNMPMGNSSSTDGTAPSSMPSSMHPSSHDDQDVWVVSRANPWSELSSSSSLGMQTISTAPYHATATSDCFDVYLRHPYRVREARHKMDRTIPLPAKHSEEEIKIKSVAVTWPDRAHVQVVADKEPDAFLTNRSPRQVIRAWTDYGGPLLLPSDGQAHYLVTVCAATPAVNANVIPTDPNVMKSSGEITNGSWTTEKLIKDFMKKDHDRSLGYLAVELDSEAAPFLIGLERAEKRVVERQHQDHDDDDFFDAFRENSTNAAAAEAVATTGTDNKIAVDSSTRGRMTAVPDSLEHLFLTTSSTKSTKRKASHTFSIGLRSEVPFEVGILHASVVVRSGPAYHSGVVSLHVSSMSKELMKPVRPETFVPDAVSIKCKVDWQLLLDVLGQKSFVIEGAVIVRGVSLFADDMPPDDLEEYQRENTFVVEIPLLIRVVAGKFGVLPQGTSHPFPSFWDMVDWTEDTTAVLSLFFPTTQFGTRVAIEEEENMYLAELKAMDHHLRVFSDMDNVPMSLKQVEILNEDKSKVTSGDDSLCSRFEVSIAGGAQPFDLPDEQDLGMIRLRYRFPSTSIYNKNKVEQNKTTGAVPTVCYLTYTTSPASGRQSLPLVVYPGHIDVSGSPFHSSVVERLPDWNVPEDESESASWYRAIFGFDNLVDWFRSTKTGSALRAVLLSSEKPGQNLAQPDSILLGRYLYSLARHSVDLENSKLRPVLLKVGAIAQGQVETLPLYLTNHNPVPVLISIDVGEVEGMSIALGRDESTGSGDGNSVLDYLPSQTNGASRNLGPEPLVSWGRLRGHPVNGLRQFLVRDEMAIKFLGQFPFRDSVSMSSLAVTKLPLLKRLYRSHARGFFHRAAMSHKEEGNKSDVREYPAPYEPFGRKLPERKLPGPLIVSIDGKKLGALRVIREKGEEGPGEAKPGDTQVFLPPGGVARFDISLRSPPSDVLDKDITEFLGTGLVLSTNQGEVIPVFVSFQALQGQLEVSNIPGGVESNQRDGVIQVPAGLFGRGSQVQSEETMPYVYSPDSNDEFGSINDGIVDVPSRAPTAGDDGVSLFMRSSFSRDIRIRRIASCNPWFNVEVSVRDLGVDSDSFQGVSIGAVSSIVACDGGDNFQKANETSFPSFFLCALSWLTRRAELQPRGCGLLPMKEVGHDKGGRFLSSDNGGMEHAIHALRQALKTSEGTISDRRSVVDVNAGLGGVYLPLQGTKSGYHSRDGIVAPILLKAAADAWDAWKTVSGLGLRTISTTLRAIVEYNSTADEKPLSQRESASIAAEDESHVLSVKIRNVTVESVLEVPMLCDTVKAQQVLLGASRGDDTSPSVLDIPPTQVGDVRSFTIPLKNPTGVPVRVRLAVAPSLDEESQQDPVTSLFLGGYQSPYVQAATADTSEQLMVYPNRQWWVSGGYFHSTFHGDVIRSHQNVAIMKSGSGAQFISPSVTFNTAFLVGCGVRCGLTEEAGQKNIPFVAEPDLTPSSPIGASAGAGYVLLGHKRSGQQPDNLQEQPMKYFAAGGSLMSQARGPLAFAIPFSALDEVIIPAHGEAELGPILFRPPGRAEILGCSSFTGVKGPSKCRSKSFESLILLENSLSGIERVVVRGATQWENIIFIDPLPKHGEDSFGNIELRNGRSTLLFTGTADFSSGKAVAAVREVVLHNSGDTVATISGMSMSLFDGSGSDNLSACQAGNFAILGCENGIEPFQLFPEKNRSIFIKHIPRCTKRKESVLLKVDLEASTNGRTTPDYRGFEPWSTIESSAFRRSKLELAVGFEMSRAEFTACVAVKGGDSVHVLKESGTKLTNKLSHPSGNKTCTTSESCLKSNFTMQWFLSSFLVLCSYAIELLVICGWAMFLARSLYDLQVDSSKFQVFLRRGRLKGQPTGNSNKAQMGNTWSAAFRCLARVDPAPQDLQTLGREQTRQIVLLRYRMIGAVPPQGYANSAGFMHRERAVPGSTASTPRQLSDGRVVQTNSSERMRTLSDGLFGKFTPSRNTQLGTVPCVLGWRTAAARGIINYRSLNASSLRLLTKDLLLTRSSHSITVSEIEEQTTGTSVDEDDSVSFQASSGEFDTSEDFSEEVAEPIPETPVPIPVPSTDESVKLTQRKTEAVSSVSKQQPGEEKPESSTQPTESGKAEVKPPGESAQPQIIRREKQHKANGSQKVEQNLPQEMVEESRNAVPVARLPETRPEMNAAPDSETVAIESTTRKDRTKNGNSHQRQKKPSVDVQANVSKSTARNPREKRTKTKSSPPKSPWKADESSQTSSPKTTGSSALRPPPGLAPPPGFSGRAGELTGSGQSIEQFNSPVYRAGADLTGELLPAPSAAVQPRFQSNGTHKVSRSSLATGKDLSLPQTTSPLFGALDGSTLQPPDHPLPFTALAGTDSEFDAMAEFDVMAFLDDILNEPTTSMDDGGATDLTDDAGQTHTFSPMNPWATTTDTYQSRAAAYGISIEDENNQRDMDPEPIDMPLLTPEVILSATGGEEVEEKTISFYADFLRD